MRTVAEAFAKEPVAKVVHLARVLTTVSLAAVGGGSLYTFVPASGAQQPTVGVPAPVEEASYSPRPAILAVSTERPTTASLPLQELSSLFKTPPQVIPSAPATGKVSGGNSSLASTAASVFASQAPAGGKQDSSVPVAASKAASVVPMSANEAEEAPEAPVKTTLAKTSGDLIMPKSYSIPTVASGGTSLTDALLAKGRVSWPVKGYGLGRQSYGPRIHPVRHTPDFHTGQDIAAPCGTPLYATGDGQVMYAAWAGGYGNRLVLRENSHITTTYSHMTAFAVEAGERVKIGQLVGTVGTTGNSTGCHLHFEVIQDGYFTNPWSWLTGKVPANTTKAYANSGYYYFNRVTQGPRGGGSPVANTTATASATPKASASPTVSATPTPQPSITSTPKPSSTPTPKPSSAPTESAPATPTATSAPTRTSSPTVSAPSSSLPTPVPSVPSRGTTATSAPTASKTATSVPASTVPMVPVATSTALAPAPSAGSSSK